MNTKEKNVFSFTLQDVNSVFGISGDTLRAIAASYGVNEDQVIIRALTQWVKTEIPDLDLDSPKLTAEQLRILSARRKKLDSTNPASLSEMFNAALIEGDQNGNASSTSPVNGGNT